MADLRLQVILSALDKVTAPLKAIRTAALPTSAALHATHVRLKELNEQQRTLDQFRTLHQGLRLSSTALHETQERVQQLARSIAASGQPSRAMTREFKAAVTAASRLKAEHAKQNQQLQWMRDRLSAAGISTNALSKTQIGLRQSIQTANAELTAQQKKLSALAAQQSRAATLRKQFSSTRESAGKLAMAGAGSVASGGGLLMSMRKILLPGIEFDAAMSRVQALSRSEKTAPEFIAMRQQARDLGAGTSFTATEAAEGQGYLAMAGFTPDQILQSMPGVLAVAKAGGADLARSADLSSDILTSFGLRADQMSRVGDVLTMTFTTANTNLDMLGETMKYIGPVAKAAGMSLEQAAAMAGLLGNVGIKSSQAGTTLRAMLLRLAAPTAATSKALKHLGVAAVDLHGNVRDIPNVLRDVARATDKMGSGKRLSFLKMIFGEEPAAGMAELIAQQGADGIGNYVRIIDASGGTAEKVAHVMANNLQGDLQTLTSAWENFGITASETIDGPLRDLTQRIREHINAVTTWAQQHPALTAMLLKTALVVGSLLVLLAGLALVSATLIVPMAALKLALGLLGLQGGLLSTVLVGLRTALRLLLSLLLGLGRALLMNPIGLAITAFALSALLIYTYWEPIKGFFNGLWNGITARFEQAKQSLRDLTTGIGNDLSNAVRNGFGIDLPTTFTEFGAGLMNGFVKGITGALSRVKTSITSAAESVIIWFKDKLGIRSPSRVFALFGDDTMQGLALGLSRSEAVPLRQVSGIAKRLAQIGADVTLGAALPGTITPALAFDTRAALAPAKAEGTLIQGDTITITINPAPGMDEAAIAKAVAKALEQRDRQKAARWRSRLADD
ncbi:MULTISPECIES: phage tail tape measure protein [unclassified Undibacterium]|uniref:phage tail tape measure protein n=1 Tax=unclassified Undibacterium TaxID=2630295 RepID=UPI002AC96FF6|nr:MULTISPECIES: phage tail tape measure protein [unclassified Undibacterium]MEB0137983.1 phage tail tape measure protein [Undibacterium sp. CCC2.1]MEB0170684.1 phage tail tape measure protein [Undibacterium sp. CCC1.1]MEB0177025.1 phage tail tape measure protein [Undibacterium sp. CCC3.4]MEB0216314.1 phage tail tape measure protein [Undibacterium sp. 5I2]WPX42498.1 phage tail tape measure protein [Undibacterium sp. CCC3.4]